MQKCMLPSGGLAPMSKIKGHGGQNALEGSPLRGSGPAVRRLLLSGRVNLYKEWRQQVTSDLGSIQELERASAWRTWEVHTQKRSYSVPAGRGPQAMHSSSERQQPRSPALNQMLPHRPQSNEETTSASATEEQGQSLKGTGDAEHGFRRALPRPAPWGNKGGGQRPTVLTDTP